MVAKNLHSTAPNELTLHTICTLPTRELFERLGGREGDRYIYRNNGSRILAVAHLDTVFDGNAQITNHFEWHMDSGRVKSPCLDDRLGVWVILNELPRRGIWPDILFTLDEECGMSTSSDFVFDRKENVPWKWIVEFDRRGEDVVTYQYQDQVWLEALTKVGFSIGMGSYSDICRLDTFGVCAANIGIGYHNVHSPYCYALLSELDRQLTRFADLVKLYEATRFGFCPRRGSTCAA